GFFLLWQGKKNPRFSPEFPPAAQMFYEEIVEKHLFFAFFCFHLYILDKTAFKAKIPPCYFRKVTI
ncbi:hypothetical protein DK853_41770, partial [Klebsiella oxytoca]